MSATRTLRLDQVVEGNGAVVEVRRGPDGSVVEAWFAMDGMPRIEPLLVGRHVADVPRIVERLCGICPVAHHLAGVRALESLAGTPPLTPTAIAVRRLLHHGAVLQTHAHHLAFVDATQARDLSEFARRVVAAAGGDSHFPLCAVPGGVLAPLAISRRDELTEQVGQAYEWARQLLGLVETARHGKPTMPTYAGHDVALVDRSGALDLTGDGLRAVAADGTVTIDGASPDDWPDLVAEARPGRAAPRPYLRAPGAEAGGYRVGPVAQLRAAAYLVTPLAEAARSRWSAACGDAAWARGVVTLHVVEAVDELLARPELVAGPVLVEVGAPVTAPRQGSGWVDGARGLLVHRYRADGVGVLRDATITTPTAQNESWLADLLGSQVCSNGPFDPEGEPLRPLLARLEAAIREADPCLPCTSSPPGQMHVRLTFIDADRQGH